MRSIFSVLFYSLAISVCLTLVFQYGVSVGYTNGQKSASEAAQTEIDSLVHQFQNKQIAFKPTSLPTTTPVATSVPAVKTVAWGGPELWTAVNKRRVEFGVNALGQRDELCTLASIRLNQLLEAGKLDGHEGFSTMPEKRPDLKWLYEKYTLTEFLVQGATSPTDAVSLWENTLGHKKLLTGGEYVWGCIYAQNSFAVAITAY
ncbi:hypothetical protein KBA63_00305 [Candidatus Woesebacteria bacterium]|nr:hypothetical protein [Candidatus Woesebacteria bacterium]MBP9687032.1 hypothetical protein [Candidatus Woesebacteria bacterium]